jgi:dTDP-glucose 4,6-dehydratase
VGSYDEISNLSLCSKLLAELQIPHSTQEELHKWIKHTHDRPFNDRRYAVDGTKLRNLGWDQKTPFEKGLAVTVDWYKKFGEQWWGDISNVLTPFPEVENKKVVGQKSEKVLVEEVEGKFSVDKNDDLTVEKANGTTVSATPMPSAA